MIVSIDERAPAIYHPPNKPDERASTTVWASIFSRKREIGDSDGGSSIRHEEVYEQEALRRRASSPWRIYPRDFGGAVDEPQAVVVQVAESEPAARERLEAQPHPSTVVAFLLTWLFRCAKLTDWAGDRSVRRGSMWGGAGGALQPAAIQTLKDTRPLRDRQYQTKMRQDVVSWLQSTEYDISMQTLANITGKEYRNIVQYLFSMLDPGYPFDPQARFEDEFTPALKCLRYPFVGQIDPKWLAAPASMHSWPSLLGVLHWLVVMCKVRRKSLSLFTGDSYSSPVQGRLHYMESEHPTLQFSGIIPEEFDDPNHHAALAFDYFAEAYEAFFAGSDDFDEQRRKIEERYGGFLVHIRLASTEP